MPTREIKVISKEEIKKRRDYERQIKIAHLEILVREFPEQSERFVKKHVFKIDGEKESGLGV